MSDTEQEPEAAAEPDVDHLVADVISMVDDLITNPDRDAIIVGLNAEIDMVQARYTVLSALRDSLTGDTEEDAQEPEPEMPLAEQEPATLDTSTSLESQIIQYISQHGPQSSKDIATAIGTHFVTVGHTVKRSKALAKDGKFITVKLS
jgi:hypothetical protein